MIKDKLGQKIKQGSWIVYGHALGRSAGLKIGRVLDLKEEPNPHAATNPWIAQNEPMIYRITVCGVDDHFGKAKLTKKGTLKFPSRVVVLDENKVLEPYKSLLKDLVETKEDFSRDVHTEHCCLKHGCKYNHDDCPVALGEKTQSYLCENCYDDCYNALVNQR